MEYDSSLFGNDDQRIKGDVGMSRQGQFPAQGTRICFLDNLRTFMIFLVVVIHTGIVYDSSGGGEYFWIVFDLSTNTFSGILNQIIDLMVMPTIFFVSGFFAPLSLKNEPGRAFLKRRFRRLMIPWIFAVFTLIPLYKVIFLYSRNMPQENWATYFHFSNGIFSQSWLWFLPVLFLFDILYLLLAKARIDISSIPLRSAAPAVSFIGFVSLFCMDFFGGRGWTKTPLLDFQNERLLIYFMVFLLGSLCFKQKTFLPEGGGKKLYGVLCLFVCISLTLSMLLQFHAMRHIGRYLVSGAVDALLHQLTLLLSMLGLMVVVINTFRFYLNKTGKTGTELNKNSYGVYIIHPVVLGVFALPLLDTAIPSFVKHLILTGATYAAGNVMVSLYRRFIKPYLSRKPREKKQ
jgi:uncharacterized membrane protein YcfT